MAIDCRKIWETVHVSGGAVFCRSDSTRRSRTPGGWLVRYEYFGGEGRSTSALLYLPDEKREWHLEKKENWETVYWRKGPNAHNVTFRLKVPGGWIVRDGYYVRWKHLSISMVFVPDADHRWELPQKLDVETVKK